ncbi:hypothetical protein SUNI508_12363 [Seiridium unicorne]|uniref:Uncharacterized protein n=1 Tax=Seiridium unicorne TaxID=138068 RepID=A0ABR2UDZ9_9PEZI
MASPNARLSVGKAPSQRRLWQGHVKPGVVRQDPSASFDTKTKSACTINQDLWRKSEEKLLIFKEQNPDLHGLVPKPFTLQDLLARNPVRQLAYSICANGNQATLFQNQTSSGISQPITFTLDWPSLDVPFSSGYTTNQLAAQIKDICERIGKDSSAIHDNSKLAIRNRAVQSLGLKPSEFKYYLRAAKYDPAIYWGNGGNRRVYYGHAVVFDPRSTDKKHTLVAIEIDCDRILPTAPIPKPDESVAYICNPESRRPFAQSVHPPPVLVDQYVHIPPGLSDEERIRHQCAVDLVHFLIRDFDGSCEPVQDVKDKIAMASISYLDQPETGRNLGGVWRGKSLCYPSRSLNTSALRPARGVEGLLKKSDVGKVPNINIHSPAYLRANSAIEAMTQASVLGRHFVDVWKTGILEGDAENDRISDEDTPPTELNCYGDQFWHFHACPACNSPALCSTFHRIAELSLDVCSRCIRKSVDTIIKEWVPDGLLPNIYVLGGSLVNADFRAAHLREKTREERSAAIKEVRRDLSQFETKAFDGKVMWKDSYCSLHETLLDKDERYQSVSGLFRSPFGASIDGVFQLAKHPVTGSHGYHIAGNVVVTTESLNRIKYRSPPVVLKALSQYRNADTDDELDNAFRGLVNDHINNTIWPRRNSAKAESLTDSEFQSIRLGMRSGQLYRQPCSEDAPFQTLSKASDLQRESAAWRPSEFDWLWKQCQEAASMHGFGNDENQRLWTTKDEQGNSVPFPFDPRSKPYVKWSWWHLWCLLRERHQRMKTRCNKYWPTDCDIHTFLLVLLHSHFEHLQTDAQQLVAKRTKDPSIPTRDPIPRDALGICPVPWNKARNSLSVAKRHHGQQMRSGFRTLRPERQSDEFDPNSCNISADTQACNFGFHNHTEDTWPDIAKQLDHLRVDDGSF